MQTPRDILGELQAWFLAHCNDDWEHNNGVTITTLDNPGWWIEIDLTHTELETRSFPPTRRPSQHRGLDRVLAGRDWLPIGLRAAQPQRDHRHLPRLGNPPGLTPGRPRRD